MIYTERERERESERERERERERGGAGHLSIRRSYGRLYYVVFVVLGRGGSNEFLHSMF